MFIIAMSSYNIVTIVTLGIEYSRANSLMHLDTMVGLYGPNGHKVHIVTQWSCSQTSGDINCIWSRQSYAI
jgi:hypothetical protein